MKASLDFSLQKEKIKQSIMPLSDCKINPAEIQEITRNVFQALGIKVLKLILDEFSL